MLSRITRGNGGAARLATCRHGRRGARGLRSLASCQLACKVAASWLLSDTRCLMRSLRARLKAADGAHLVAAGLQDAEAVPVDSQHVREEVGVAGVALAAGGVVARAGGIRSVRVDGYHLVAGLAEGVDQHTVGEAASLLVDDAQAVFAGAPVDAGVAAGVAVQGVTLCAWRMLASVGRSCRLLTAWHSRNPVRLWVQHPSAGRDLPALASGRVSGWPSRGEPSWPYPQARRERLSPTQPRARKNPPREVHQ